MNIQEMKLKIKVLKGVLGTLEKTAFIAKSGLIWWIKRATLCGWRICENAV
jgi:hypothetical protein